MSVNNNLLIAIMEYEKQKDKKDERNQTHNS